MSDPTDPEPQSPKQKSYTTAEPTRSGRGFVLVALGLAIVFTLIYFAMFAAESTDGDGDVAPSIDATE